MGKSSHNIYIEDEDWTCLGKYSLDTKSTKSKIIRKLITDFLSDNKDKINEFREKQEKAMIKRNAI